MRCVHSNGIISKQLLTFASILLRCQEDNHSYLQLVLHIGFQDRQFHLVPLQRLAPHHEVASYTLVGTN